MSKFAELIARAMGMNDGIADLILHASPMHDIGKLGIPTASSSSPADWTRTSGR